MQLLPVAFLCTSDVVNCSEFGWAEERRCANVVMNFRLSHKSKRTDR